MKSRWKKPFFWHRSAAESQELVEECEAFLNGRYLVRSVRHRSQLPPWAWLNTLAHGERADIEALAEARWELPHDRGAAQFFAREVLATADLNGLDLKVLQRELLVPVELDCDVTSSASVTKALCTSLLAALRRASTIASQRPEGRPISELRHRPDASP